MNHTIMTTLSRHPLPWPHVLAQHARQRPRVLLGLGIALMGVLVLLLQGQVWLAKATQHEVVRWALWGGSAGMAATTLGALPAVFLKSLKAQHEDAMLGMAAGMMLAAAAFSLLLPGIEAGTQLTGHALKGAGLVVLGMGLGVLLMLGLDTFTPHEHDKTGPCGPGHERCQRGQRFTGE